MQTSKNEGEEGRRKMADRTSETNRLEKLQEAYNLGFDYVDIELKAPSSLKYHKKSQQRRLSLIHDFKQTPSFHQMN